MKKPDIVKNMISLFIIVAIITSLLIYYTQTYLILPFMAPMPIQKERSITFGITFYLIKKPVEIEVMTDLNPFADKTEGASIFR